jgi:hypothetical protein
MARQRAVDALDSPRFEIEQRFFGSLTQIELSRERWRRDVTRRVCQ